MKSLVIIKFFSFKRDAYFLKEGQKFIKTLFEQELLVSFKTSGSYQFLNFWRKEEIQQKNDIN